jgi:hypothetical protein
MQRRIYNRAETSRETCFRVPRRQSVINQARERRNALERRGFFIPPRYYTGAITRAITAGDQPTRFAAPSCAQGIAARTIDARRDCASGE